MVLTSLPLFEISQTVNGVTTSTTYGVGFGCFILAIAYFIPTIFRLVMARYYPKKTFWDEIDVNAIMTLLPFITSLFEKRSTRPTGYSHSHEGTYQTGKADAEATMLFEILRTQDKGGETEIVHEYTEKELTEQESAEHEPTDHKPEGHVEDTDNHNADNIKSSGALTMPEIMNALAEVTQAIGIPIVTEENEKKDQSTDDSNHNADDTEKTVPEENGEKSNTEMVEL